MLEKIMKRLNNDYAYGQTAKKSYAESYDYEEYLKVKDPIIRYHYISVQVPRQSDRVPTTVYTTYKEDHITSEFMVLYERFHTDAMKKLCGGTCIDFGLILPARHIEIYFDKKSIIFEKLSLKKALFLAHWIAYTNKTRVMLSTYSNEVFCTNIIYNKDSKTFEYKYNCELDIEF